ncbi:hypothetical protein PHET_05836 [Paragonimus heterotremus]|uniref:Uncharacterized protein n=1 Tax=Paragonimus heterotremus TaxID=100268 RepID=A0A8J4WGP2_9TREM|nr:hypothetical protein PHET_05836 [Paragonimus heterotremus]
MLVGDVDCLSYNDLRKVAKLYNIKTNKKAARLRSELKRAIGLENTARYKGSDLIQYAVLKPNTSGSSPNLTCERPCPLSKNSPLRDEENDLLNAIYEVSSPVFSEHTSPVVTEFKGPSGTILPSLEDCPKLSSVTMLNRKDLPTSMVSTDFLVKPSKTDVPKLTKNIAKSFSVRTVPDFGRIHARAAAKMESLPDFLRRRQNVMTVLSGTTGRKHTGEKSNSNTLTSVPLTDLSNREVGLPLKRSDLTVFSGHTSVCSPVKHRSNPSLNSLSSRLSTKRQTPTIPEDSAFSRRKAYDLKRRLSHTGLLPKGISTNNDSPNPPMTSSSLGTMVTVRRRDPVVRSLSAHVAIHKQRAHVLNQKLRQDAKQAVISGRRGLLPV